MKVRLEVVQGSCKGRTFEFDEQDSFTLGRAPDCKCVVAGDPTFSRHHLLLEISQGNVTLKDLGSLNGTRVNGVKHGGREKGVAPEDAACSPPVALRDGDSIEAGNNTMVLHVEGPALCVDCGEEIPAAEKRAAEFINGTYLCLKCRRREEERQRPKKPEEPARKPESEKPQVVRMDPEQRRQAEGNPGAVIEDLLRQFMGLQAQGGGAPEIQGYADLKKIGEGGFGAAYKARRVSDGNTVVIKTMLQTRKPPRVQMLLFDREKEIAVQLMHPNVVRAERAGAWNEIHFIEMEFMDGGSVWDLMTGGTRALPLDRAAPIILQALEGLAYAHEASVSVTTDKGKKTQRGVIHRDLKPPNILLTHQGGRVVAKLSDFGLAKSFAAAGCTQGSLSQSQAGSFCGSPCYMAPEHICNYKYVKPPTDVFEMAATFFHMLTGRPVWPLGPGKDIFKVILESEPLRLKDHLPSCPKPLAQVFDRALARDPAERPASGQELLDAMRKVLK